MRPLLRTFSLTIAVALVLSMVATAHAQGKPPEGTVYSWSGVPLETALYEIADLSGIAVVFAHRLVGSRYVSASYKVGDDPHAALEAMLAGSGLRAERIRRGRYVIIAEPLNVLVEADDPAAYTGTMRGQVVDAVTGEPLWGAHVWLIEVDLGDVVGPDGSFEVPGVPTGEYLVRFSYVGYKPVRTRLSVYPASPQVPPTIRLQPETFISTEATVRPGEEPEAPPGSTDLAARQAASLPVNLGEGDLAQTLVWLPGLTRSAAGRGELVVRGADPGMTQYMLDGVPFIRPWHAYGLFSAFQPEALQRVQFHKGSLPAELGDGLAGVVELESKNGLVGRAGGVAAISPIAARAMVEAPIGNRTGVFIAARRSILNWFFPPSLARQSAAVVLDPLGTDGTAGIEGAAQSFFDVEGRLSWNPREQHRLTVGAYAGGDHLNAPAALGPSSFETDNKWGNSLGSIKYSVLGRRAFVSAMVYHTRFDSEEATIVRETDVTVDQAYSVGFRESGGRVDVDYYHSVAHQLRFGLRVREQRLRSQLVENLTNGDDIPMGRDELAASAATDGEIYIQDMWQPVPAWRMQLGIRAGLYGDGSYVDVSPRAHIRWTVRPDRLYLRGGLSHQVQSLHRIQDRYAYTYDLTTSRWLLSGAAVSPASAWQLGFGAEWAPLPFLAFSFDSYTRLMKNVLEPIDPFGVGDALLGPSVDVESLLRFYRPSEGRAHGLEFAGRAEYGSWILGLSYALSRSEVNVPGGNGWRLSEYDRPHALGVLIQRKGSRWSAAARVTLQSGLPTIEQQYNGIVESRFPTEVRMDISAGYRFRWLGFQWDAQAQALNLSGAPTLEEPLFADGTAAFLATDVRSRALLPLLSLKATW